MGLEPTLGLRTFLAKSSFSAANPRTLLLLCAHERAVQPQASAPALLLLHRNHLGQEQGAFLILFLPGVAGWGAEGHSPALPPSRGHPAAQIFAQRCRGRSWMRKKKNLEKTHTNPGRCPDGAPT